MAAQRYQLQSVLLSEIRQATGYENNDHVTDDEIKRQIDRAARLLFDLFLECYGPEPYRDEQLIDINVGTSIYDLDANVHQVLGVYSALIDGIDEAYTIRLPWWRVEMFEEHDRLDLMNDEDGRLRRLRYRLMGAVFNGSGSDRDQIELLPTPTEDGRVKVVYVPSPELSSIEGDLQVFAPGGSSEYIVGYVGAYIRNKEKDDPGFFLGKMKMVEDKARAYAARRDQKAPPRMAGRSGLVLPRGDYVEDWEP